MVALANTQGGRIIIGIDDKTAEMNGLSFAELQASNALLANAAANNVKAHVYIYTETVKVKQQNLIVAHIPEGASKPYKELYDKTLSFITRNLKKIQKEEGFNTPADMEIPLETIKELLVNALVHRDYFMLSSIKVFIFDNRIEITSPGKLPNTLTVDHIKMGTSMPRNPILFTNARYLLPFVGVGSGIPRAIKNSPDLELINDLDREVFTAVIKRPE